MVDSQFRSRHSYAPVRFSLEIAKRLQTKENIEEANPACKNILFVSWTSRNDRPYFDPSVRYRCFNFANELIKRGHSATVISQVRFQEIYRELPKYDAYVFHRPYLTQELSEFLQEHNEQDLVIADFDDLIFDVRYAELTPMVRVRGGDSKAVRSYLSKTYDAASLFNKFTLSTTPLKEHTTELFPHAESIVLSNSIDPGFLGLSRVARRTSPLANRPTRLVIFQEQPHTTKTLQ